MVDYTYSQPNLSRRGVFLRQKGKGYVRTAVELRQYLYVFDRPWSGSFFLWKLKARVRASRSRTSVFLRPTPRPPHIIIPSEVLSVYKINSSIFLLVLPNGSYFCVVVVVVLCAGKWDTLRV